MIKKYCKRIAQSVIVSFCVIELWNIIRSYLLANGSTIMLVIIGYLTGAFISEDSVGFINSVIMKTLILLVLNSFVTAIFFNSGSFKERVKNGKESIQSAAKNFNEYTVVLRFLFSKDVKTMGQTLFTLSLTVIVSTYITGMNFINSFYLLVVGLIIVNQLHQKKGFVLSLINLRRQNKRKRPFDIDKICQYSDTIALGCILSPLIMLIHINSKIIYTGLFSIAGIGLIMLLCFSKKKIKMAASVILLTSFLIGNIFKTLATETKNSINDNHFLITAGEFVSDIDGNEMPVIVDQLVVNGKEIQSGTVEIFQGDTFSFCLKYNYVTLEPLYYYKCDQCGNEYTFGGIVLPDHTVVEYVASSDNLYSGSDVRDRIETEIYYENMVLQSNYSLSGHFSVIETGVWAVKDKDAAFNCPECNPVDNTWTGESEKTQTTFETDVENWNYELYGDDLTFSVDGLMAYNEFIAKIMSNTTYSINWNGEDYSIDYSELNRYASGAGTIPFLGSSIVYIPMEEIEMEETVEQSSIIESEPEEEPVVEENETESNEPEVKENTDLKTDVCSILLTVSLSLGSVPVSISRGWKRKRKTLCINGNIEIPKIDISKEKGIMIPLNIADANNEAWIFYAIPYSFTDKKIVSCKIIPTSMVSSELNLQINKKIEEDTTIYVEVIAVSSNFIDEYGFEESMIEIQI